MDIKAKLNQSAVYWLPLHADGFGGYALTPVSTNTTTGTATGEDVTAQDIDCRWQAKVNMVLNAEGEEVVSSAVVYTDTAVVVGGYLWLGALSAAPSDPSDPDNAARKVLAVDTSPSVDGTQALYKAYL